MKFSLIKNSKLSCHVYECGILLKRVNEFIIIFVEIVFDVVRWQCCASVRYVTSRKKLK